MLAFRQFGFLTSLRFPPVFASNSMVRLPCYLYRLFRLMRVCLALNRFRSKVSSRGPVSGRVFSMPGFFSPFPLFYQDCQFIRWIATLLCVQWVFAQLVTLFERVVDEKPTTDHSAVSESGFRTSVYSRNGISEK